MCDVLELLRHLDRHFQRTTGVDVPAQSKTQQKKDALGNKIDERVYIDSETYDTWRRVRSAIAGIESESR